MRKRCIGKKVRVEVEFIKKIPVKKLDGTGEELKDFTYASVFENNLNLAAYMLEQGLVSVQQIILKYNLSILLKIHLEVVGCSDISAISRHNKFQFFILYKNI